MTTRRMKIAALAAGLIVLAAAPSLWADAGDGPETRRVTRNDDMEGRRVGRGAPSTLWDWVRTVVALGVVVALIFAIRWALRRWGAPAGAAPGGGPLDVLARRSLSAKHQLYLVRMGDRLLLLGGAGDALRTLAEVTDEEEAAALLDSLERAKTGPPGGDRQRPKETPQADDK